MLDARRVLMRHGPCFLILGSAFGLRALLLAHQPETNGANKASGEETNTRDYTRERASITVYCRRKERSVAGVFGSHSHQAHRFANTVVLMGGNNALQKIRTRGASIARRGRPNTPPRIMETGESKLSFQVVSVPKEYDPEHAKQSFNWMTNKLDSFQISHCATSNDETVKTEPAEKPKEMATTASTDCSSGWGEWWLFPCWGSTTKLDQSDELKTAFSSQPESMAETSYDGSGSSSEPSCSMEGEVLEVNAIVDDVSDVTSTPSENGSDSESEDDSDDSPSYRDSKTKKSMVGVDVKRERFEEVSLSSSDSSLSY